MTVPSFWPWSCSRDGPTPPSSPQAPTASPRRSPFTRAVRILRQVCDGLAPAHAARIYHRDLKPDNLMLTRLGPEQELVKILDFGIARLDSVTTQITREGTTLGTPTYMAPEQARGEAVDQRSDIYSLGIILFEMLTGQVPFTAETPLGVLMQHCEKPVGRMLDCNPDADVSDGVQALVEELLSKRPGLRPDNVREVRARLESLVARHEPRGEAGQRDRNLRSVSPAFRRPSAGPDLPEPSSSTEQLPSGSGIGPRGVVLRRGGEHPQGTGRVVSAPTADAVLSSGPAGQGSGAAGAASPSAAALPYAATEESPVDGTGPAPLTPAPPANAQHLAGASAGSPPAAGSTSSLEGLPAQGRRRGWGWLVGVAAVLLLGAGAWAGLAGPWAGGPSPTDPAQGGAGVDAGAAGQRPRPPAAAADGGGGAQAGDPTGGRPPRPERAAGGAPAGRGAQPSRGAGSAADAGSPPAGPEVEATVEVLSDPTGARVMQGRRSLGTTPLKLPSPEQALNLRLVKGGYRSARLRLAAGASGERRAKLRRRRTVRPDPPVAGPAPEEQLDDLK